MVIKKRMATVLAACRRGRRSGTAEEAAELRGRRLGRSGAVRRSSGGRPGGTARSGATWQGRPGTRGAYCTGERRRGRSQLQRGAGGDTGHETRKKIYGDEEGSEADLGEKFFTCFAHWGGRTIAWKFCGFFWFFFSLSVTLTGDGPCWWSSGWLLEVVGDGRGPWKQGRGRTCGVVGFGGELLFSLSSLLFSSSSLSLSEVSGFVGLCWVCNGGLGFGGCLVMI